MIVSTTQEKLHSRIYYLVAFLSLILLPLMLLPLVKHEEGLLPQVAEKRERPFVLERIGSGPLSLEVLRFPRLIERMKDELLFLSITSRPNFTKDRMILLGLKSAEEVKRVMNGQPLFLYEEGGGRMRVSAHSTPLSLTATLVDPVKLAVTIVRKKEGEEERAEILLPRSASPFLPHGVPKFFQELKEGKCLGQDLVLKNLQGKAEECRFQIMNNLFHLKSGDLLLWKGGEWSVVTQEEAGSHLPLARVRKSSPQGLEFEIWDGGGFSCGELKAAALPPQKPLVRAADQFTGARLRNRGEVVVAYGKRRLVLREGDWLLKQGDRMRHLRRPQEIADLLALRLHGELFIVEGVSRLQEKMQVKLLHFDEMRLQSELLELPLQSRERAVKKERQVRLPQRKKA